MTPMSKQGQNLKRIRWNSTAENKNK